MSLNNASPGFHSAPEYVSSGLPYVTSSSGQGTTPTEIAFSYVTKNIVIDVTGSTALRVGFTLNGVNSSNYFLVRPQTSMPFDIRTRSVFVRADSGTTGYSMIAALTLIPVQNAPILSGTMSGSFGWSGVG